MADSDDHKTNRFRRAVPALPVRNCGEALRYYCDVLGFKKDFDDEVLGVDRTLYAGVSRDEFEIRLNEHDTQEYKATIGCEVDDVNNLYEEFLSKGVPIVIPPRDEPWGMRHMAIEDLYGHQIHFQSRMR